MKYLWKGQNWNRNKQSSAKSDFGSYINSDNAAWILFYFFFIGFAAFSSLRLEF